MPLELAADGLCTFISAKRVSNHEGLEGRIERGALREDYRRRRSGFCTYLGGNSDTRDLFGFKELPSDSFLVICSQKVITAIKNDYIDKIVKTGI